MSRLLAVLLVPFVLAAPVQADSLARGRQIASAFIAGDTAAVWAEMTPALQQALGSAGAFAGLRAGIGRSLGDEAALLSEELRPEGGLQVYRRLSRWTGDPVPLQLSVGLDGEGRVAAFLAAPEKQAAPSVHLDYRTRAALRLPFEGQWHVVWGGRSLDENYHAVDPGQRFALDLLVMVDGASHVGDPRRLDSYHCWGRPVLAPAAGRVVAAVDGLPDQRIGASDAKNPAGNHVVIDFGQGEFGFLAHLRWGSVAVRKGATVQPGDEIGRCGNSGNTSEPHLHFHLQTTPTLGEGAGLPAQFQSYRANGRPVDRGEPRRGQTVAPMD